MDALALMECTRIMKGNCVSKSQCDCYINDEVMQPGSSSILMTINGMESTYILVMTLKNQILCFSKK